MKVLLVSDYATLTGGAEIFTLALRTRLRQRGHDARLFTSGARPTAGASPADYECLGTTSRWRTLLQTANPWACVRLRRVLAEFQPDVVHVQMFLTQLSPLILPVLKEVPSLYHVVWYRPVCPLGTKMLPDGTACHVPAGAVCYRTRCLPLRDWVPLMVQMQLWRRWQNAFDLIVANSHAVKACLVAEGIGPVEVIWYGVPVRPLRPSLLSPPTVVFAGRLVREKGVDVLVRAFAAVVTHLSEARLLVVGEGPEREHLEKLITDLGLSSRVALLGHLPHEEAERVCATAWVQAVPSRWAEPFGIVAAEALMRGTAVVASNAGGLAEIVQDGQTGLLVPPGDVDALAAALLRLLRDRELAEQLGQAGRQSALVHFNEDACIEKFLAVYHRLSGQQSSV